MRRIKLKVARHLEDQLKIVWEDEYTTTAVYFVRKQRLQGVVDRIRFAAEDLVRTHLDAIDLPATPFDYSPTLGQLAKRGEDLYYELFEGVEPQLGRQEAVDGKRWLEQINEPVELIVSSDSSIHIPWGLVFGGEQRAVPSGSESLADYQNFWALKYLISITYSGMGARELRQARPRQTLKLLSLLNKGAFEAAHGELDNSERSAIDTVLEHPAGRASTWDECLTKWASMTTDDCLLHVYAHATGQEIWLTSDAPISLTDLNRSFFEPRRLNRSRIPECLMLLNGCDTAVGNLSDSFLTLTAGPGCSGFVGLEVKIPRRFALRFGTSLLYLLLYTGLTVQEALNTLRRRHWPLGILYACVAHPLFRLEAAPEPPPEPYLQSINFSYLK